MSRFEYTWSRMNANNNNPKTRNEPKHGWTNQVNNLLTQHAIAIEQVTTNTNKVKNQVEQMEKAQQNHSKSIQITGGNIHIN